MEIISVTRGDDPSDPWRLCPSIKGMFPFRPACLCLASQMHYKDTTFTKVTFRLGQTWHNQVDKARLGRLIIDINAELLGDKLHDLW